MLNRKIPAADFSQWIVDVALDGRLKPGNHETQVVLLHDKNKANVRKLCTFRLSKRTRQTGFR